MLFKSSFSVNLQILISTHLSVPCNFQCMRACLCVAILLLPFMNLISSNASCSCGSVSSAKTIKPNRWAWQENSHQQAGSQLWARCSIIGEDMNHLSTRKQHQEPVHFWELRWILDCIWRFIDQYFIQTSRKVVWDRQVQRQGQQLWERGVCVCGSEQKCNICVHLLFFSFTVTSSQITPPKPPSPALHHSKQLF